MKKNTAKILIAVLCLMMAIGIATGSTFAWFSMNNKVLVTGMTVTTKVSNNLLIAPADSSDATYDGNRDANYLISLNQTREGTLEPASTINGVSFWYTATSNVEGSGDAKNDVYTAYSEATAQAHAGAGKAAYDAGFNANYGFDSPSATATGVAYAYIDYSFYLKGTNAEAVDRKVFMDKCNLLYDGAAPTDRAFRVAVFAQSASKDTKQVTALASTDVKTILTPSGATNFTSTDYAVSNGTTIADLAYGHVSADNDITAYNQRAVIGEVAAGDYAYYKVTVRLWLEGEDNTCNNDTYASLTGDWTLDLSFTLGDAGVDDGNAVNQIGGTAVATLGKSTVTGTAALNTGAGGVPSTETASTYTFYNATTGAVLQAASATATYTNAADATVKVYAVITTEKGNTYRTPVVELDAAPAP